MSAKTVEPAASVRGEVVLPGDKSLSHRALLFAALGTEPVDIRNLAISADVGATLDVVRQLGATVDVDSDDPTSVRILGRGMRGLTPSDQPLDARNSGTLARLLPGILVGQEAGSFTLVGDESLSSRPMTRIADPLRQMGAQLETTPAGTLPMTITAGAALHGLEYELPVASAQVQSAVLLAGLFADGPTTVTEPGPIRDHTERALRRAGATVKRTGAAVTLHPARELQLPDTTIAADPSSAAFFLAAATLLPESLIRLPGVLANTRRTGFVEILERMGGRIGVLARTELDGEPVYDIEVTHARLERIHITARDVPRAVDELPLLGLVAQFCKGETVIRGAGELRLKETDRIRTTVSMLRAIGVNAEETGDGFAVRGSGSRPEGGRVNAEGDHRIAMVAGIAGLVSRGGVTIEDAECVDVSFPGFFDVVSAIAVR